MKALVLGGEGMLGHKMYQTLLGRHPDTACTILGSLADDAYRGIELFDRGKVFERINALDLDALGKFLRQVTPDFVVNCIGIVKQRENANVPTLAITLNALLPHKLVEFSRTWGGRVVHISTDCVFSGKRGGYGEDDPSDAGDLYGKTKYLGEVTDENALTLRTSIIGRELAQFKSLLEWFLAQNGKSVHGYRRVIYSGVTTNYLASIVARLIADQPGLSGRYQVVAPSISKFDLLALVREAFGLKIEIIPDDGEVSDRSMVGAKFVQATGYRCPEWRQLVDELAHDSTPYAKWRTRTR